MKKIIYSLITLVLLTPVFWSCTDKAENVEAGVPELISVIPVTGPSGSTIIISGLNFSPVAEENVVTIGGLPATVKSATENRLTVTVPEHEDGKAEVKVTVKGIELGGFTFTYAKLIDPEIVIGSIAPAQAYVGDEITIFGENFSDDKKEVKVKFGESQANIISSSENIIKVTAPQNSLGDVVVEITSKSKKASIPFKYVDLTMSGNRPTEGGKGTIVTIMGTGFNTDPAKNKVVINDIEIVPTEATYNTLSVIMPDLPWGTYEFTVETHGKTVKGGSFTVVQVWTVETVAGKLPQNHVDGIGKAAQFYYAQNISRDADGLLWITQRGGTNKDAIRVMDPETYEVKTVVPTSNTLISNGHPWGSCFDKHGNYWFTLKAKGSDNILRIDAGTTEPKVMDIKERTVASNSMYILVDDNDNIYILNRSSSASATSYLSIYDKSFKKLHDYSIGTGFITSMAFTVDKSKLLLGTSGKACIYMLDPADGTFSKIAGTGSTPNANSYTDGETGKPLTATIGIIDGIAVAQDGTVYFTDATAQTLRKLIPGENGDYTKGTIKTIAGTAMKKGNQDGIGTNATFSAIAGICLMPDGSILIADSAGLIRRAYSN